MLSATTDGTHSLREIDYDTYAAGEAVLGWLNATVELTGRPTFDPTLFTQELMLSVRQASRQEGAEIAHLKIALSNGEHFLKANVTANSDDLDSMVMPGPRRTQPVWC